MYTISAVFQHMLTSLVFLFLFIIIFLEESKMIEVANGKFNEKKKTLILNVAKQNRTINENVGESNTNHND